MKLLELLPAALAEAEEAAAWYAERDPRVAARFAEELHAPLRHRDRAGRSEEMMSRYGPSALAPC